jgi:hypothetical protein
MDLPSLNQDELLRRLPEIDRIEGSLKRKTINAFLDHCPDYFWEQPAASSHHPDDQQQQLGLWLHTKRAFVSFERKARSFIQQELINLWELNCGRSAILLHDIFKYGVPPEIADHTLSDHDRLAADYLNTQTALPEQVIRCIDTHSGPWGGGDSPETWLEQLHHLADMDASDRNLQIAVYQPCHELTERFSHLKQAELEDI